MAFLHGLIEGKPEDALAIIDHDGTRYSYGELAQMVERTAQALAAHGVRPGDRLILLSENSALFSAVVLAASRLEAWIVPYNVRHSAAEVRAVMEHCSARCAVVTDSTSAQGAEHAEALRAGPLLQLPCGALTTSAIREAEPETVPRDPAQRIGALMYTTGTTSAPKGVMLTHANLNWNARASARLRDMAASDVVIGVLPTTHIFGFSSTFLATLYAGAAIRCLPRFSPKAVLSAFAEGDTMMPAVPQMYARLLRELEETGRALEAPRLRYLSAGGAPLDPAVKARTEAVFGLALNNGYGLTETSPSVAATRPGAPRSDLSVGPAVEDVSLKIAAPDAAGEGELLIRGPGVMKGYYRAPELTAGVFTEDGWLRSGDIARIDPDGAVHIVGRAKEIIIRSGFNVHPPEVEAMLTRHPLVHEAAVVGRSRHGNEEVIAFVIAEPSADEGALRAWLRELIAPYKVPRYIIKVDEFPTASTGKILKHTLIDHFGPELAAREAVADAR